MPPTRETCLERNLEVLARASGPAAAAILKAASLANLNFTTAADGSVTAELSEGGTRRRLGSAHRPLEEARTLVADVDVTAAAVVVVCGFGLGHHVRLLAERMKRTGLIVVFEPNVGQLRAVLEHIDCSNWLSEANVVVLTDENETGEISKVTRGFEAAVACGLRLIEHPPSRPLIGERWKRFTETFTTVVKAVRTAVVTTLVHVDISLRNALQNIDHYVSWPGLNDLAGVAKGRAAIIVSAGPSLERNLHLLEDPAVRERFVIIAAQTVLKPLLARGIKPHYVTALDYHEISRRFYEGLTPELVEGITLVVEPKANPAILEAFPGAIRCVADRVLDETLGPAFGAPETPRSELQPGATVAHLACYLARHLGADPIILVGQDLGFTDHCYYAANAAIHRVWGPELGQFRTLEMLEWERIARMKGLLRRTTDQAGRPMFTDEQMATYLVQFERDFLADTQRGLTIIDATEGGCHKRHTKVMTLAQAIDLHSPATRFHPPATLKHADTARRIDAVRARLTDLAAGVAEMKQRSDDTADLMRRMKSSQADQIETNRLIGEVHAHAAKVDRLGTAHWLVQYLSQTSQLRRFKADRAMEIAGDTLTPFDRQTREIDRDLSNVTWLAESAGRVKTLLAQTQATLAGEPRRTAEDTQAVEDRAARPDTKVGAILVFDHLLTGLNTPRPRSPSPEQWLHATLDRLANVEGLAGVLLLVPPHTQLTNIAMPCGVETLTSDEWTTWQQHRAMLGAARAFQPLSWRGAIGNSTIFDEAVCPAIAAAAAARHHWDAVLIIGSDWTNLDAELNTALVNRFRELETPTVVFSQAAPGLVGAVAPVTLLRELGNSGSKLATLGGVLGYLPAAPQADPIAKSPCVHVHQGCRDAFTRHIAAEHDRAADGLPSHIEVGTGLRSNHALLCALTTLVQHRPDLAVTFDLRGLLADLVRDRATLCFNLARAAGVAALHLHLDAHAAGPWLNTLACEVVSLDFGTTPTDAVQEQVLATLRANTCSRWIVPRLTKSADNLERMEGWYDFWLTVGGCAVIDPPGPNDRLTALPWPAAADEARTRSEWRIEPSGRIRSRDGVVADLALETMATVIDRVQGLQAETREAIAV